jgi:hypothetical protein
MEKEGLPISWLLRSLRGAPFHAEIEPTFCINSARDVPGPNAPDNRPLLDCTCDENGNARMSWKPEQGLHNRPRVSDWAPQEPYAEKAAPTPKQPAQPAGRPPVVFGDAPVQLPTGWPTGGGAPASGLLGSALLRAVAAIVPIAEGKGALDKGKRGPAVQALQAGFLALGLPVPGGADGVFGNGTAEAVKRFQRDHGLGVDGVAGKATVRALDKALVAMGK